MGAWFMEFSPNWAPERCVFPAAAIFQESVIMANDLLSKVTALKMWYYNLMLKIPKFTDWLKPPMIG